MRRRNFIAGLGSLTAAGAAAVSTGAFTSVSADRSVTVEVADDDAALLGLEPSPGPNGAYASQSGGTLALDFSDTDAGGSGVGTDSVYQFDDVFRVTNRGTQPVYVWVTLDFSSVGFGPGDVYFYPDRDEDEKLRDGSDEVLGLGVGQSASVGVYVDSAAVTSGGTLSATIHANADKPNPSEAVDGGGEDFAVVTENPTESNEYASIQAAVSNVEGSTVYVRDGTYDVGTDRLNVRPADLDDSVGSLSIVGESRDGVVVDATDRDSWGVYVTADDVTLENLTLKGPTYAGTGYPSGYYGIHVSGAENFTLRNATVEGSAVNQVSLNSVDGATIEGVTVDGLESENGTGVFASNARNVELRDVTARNNPWGGVGISAWQDASYPTPHPATRNVSLTGDNVIKDRPLVYTEEQPGSDYHTGGSRGQRVDTGGDGDWDVSFPLDGGVASGHDLTAGSVDTGSTTGSLGYTVVFERFDDGTADQVGELYFVSESERDATVAELEAASGQYTYSVLATDTL